MKGGQIPSKSSHKGGAYGGNNPSASKSSSSALVTPAKGAASGPRNNAASDGKKKVRLSGAAGLEKYRILSTADKDESLLRLRGCIDAGLLDAGASHLITLGFNTVMKALESHRATIVCGFRDSPASLMSALYDAARHRGVPMVVFPKCSGEFARALRVKTLACFAFTTHKDPTRELAGVTGGAGAEGGGVIDASSTDLLVLEGTMDALRELLVERASLDR